jgi:hypothetical protein
MIDTLSLALSHGLLFLVAWRLYYRCDLDVEAPPKIDAAPTTKFGKPR